MRIAQIARVVAAWTAIGLGGCGSGIRLGEVTGVVTLNGQPTSGLQVQFDPQDISRPSSLGFTRADGTYRLQSSIHEPGAVLGVHTVRVRAAEGGEGASPVVIAKRYNDESTLTCAVKAGTNTYNIEITSP